MTQPDAAALFHAFLSAAEDAVLLVVQRGEITLASAAAGWLLGDGAAPGGSVASLFDERSRAKLSAALAHDVAAPWELQARCGSDVPRAVKFLVIPAAGGARVLLGRASSPEEARRLEEVVVTLTSELADITRDLARKGAELEAARARLEELGQQREEFMSIVSHDLKASLQAVRLQAALLARVQRPPEPAQCARMAGVLFRNVDRMTSLISDLLDAALAEAGELRIGPQRMALRDVIAEVIDTVAPIAGEASVEIHVDAAEPGLVTGDARRLYQVLLNLVENAIRHSPRGGDVYIEVAARGDRVRCAVEDSGLGVEPERRVDVFARFRKHGPRSGRAGLGLYIAQRIIALHGGSIGVEAGARGGGARFVFEVPAAIDEAAAGGDAAAGDAPAR
ncbi:sensor histidine kinase [Sorangium sp. So ce131]|uniref:sensor histidine kinase n=1 Tax=Sorangium sp. So ce131 TaxID=3133282 RepID=UPI003F638FAB